jgi:class 3 adenylate cyclase
VIDGKLRGVAVHIGARVAEHAAPGEVLVSRTLRDLVTGVLTGRLRDKPRRTFHGPGLHSTSPGRRIEPVRGPALTRRR